MGVVDTAVVGRAGGLPLAGVGLGLALFMALSVLGMGIMHGLDPLVSQAVGAGDAARARRLLWQGVWLAALLSVALAVPFAVAPSLLEPLGIAPDIAREAGRYLLWRLPGLPFFLAWLAARTYLQSLGSTRPMVVSMAIANVVNVAADLVLVLGGASLPAWAGPLRAVPPLGAAGAALATSLCSVLQLVDPRPCRPRGAARVRPARSAAPIGPSSRARSASGSRSACTWAPRSGSSRSSGSSPGGSARCRWRRTSSPSPSRASRSPSRSGSGTRGPSASGGPSARGTAPRRGAPA